MEFRDADPVVVPPGEGKVLDVLGETIHCKLVSEDTGEAFSLFECRTPPNAGPPLHTHQREDEAYFVLEGEYEVHCGDRTFRATPGTMFLLPRDIPHTFRNVSKTPGRMLITATPAGVERFWQEVSQLGNQNPDPQKLKKIAKKHHIDLEGPPFGPPGKVN